MDRTRTRLLKPGSEAFPVGQSTLNRKWGRPMAQKCPKCGLELKTEPKFCPACGAPTGFSADPKKKLSKKTADKLSDQEASKNADKEPSEERRFVLRKTNYGDTDLYDSPGDYKKPDPPSSDATSEALSDSPQNHSVSLYLSLAAIILAVAAIILVLIFAVFPSSGQSSSDPADNTQAQQTLAPTEPPTDPPITGTYHVVEFQGKESGVGMAMLKRSTLEMKSDYTGKILFSTLELGAVTLKKGSDSATFMNINCTYTFDGSILTIDYNGITLVYKKD